MKGGCYYLHWEKEFKSEFGKACCSQEVVGIDLWSIKDRREIGSKKELEERDRRREVIRFSRGFKEGGLTEVREALGVSRKSSISSVIAVERLSLFE